MKFTCLLFILFLSYTPLGARDIAGTDTIVPTKGNENKQLGQIKKEKIEQHSDASGNAPEKKLTDTTVQNKYGDLLNDDTAYNKKYPLWKPALQVVGLNLSTFLLDRYVGKYDFSIPVGFKSWGHNIKTGWEWDTDRFGINFIGHPYSGTLTFNAARSNGYTFWQSFPFAVGGSLMWEYLGENTLPSYNDIINTPVNGAFLGEIFYRISSNILDDRTRGTQRFFRELAAGLIDPARGFNRLLQGKSFRHTNKEVYQKEPLNITLYAGMLTLGSNPQDLTKAGATINEILNLQLDYGNPFENRPRKPFDFFKFRIDLSYGVGRKIIDNVTGYGILTGKNFQSDSGNKAMLVGLFQYNDYWDNKTFELGAIGFGGGIITKLPVSKASKSALYTSLHLAAIPFAGSSTRVGPDTSQFRDYNFGFGMEGKFESTINFSKWATATLVAYYYWIHTYAGLRENNFIGIVKPRASVRLIKNLSIGFEEAFYYNGIHSPGLPVVRINRTEQKVFLMLYWEDKQRQGHYN
jgi:hypothetical protein